MVGVYKCRKLLISVSDVDDDGDKERKVVIRVMIPAHRGVTLLDVRRRLPLLFDYYYDYTNPPKTFWGEADISMLT